MPLKNDWANGDLFTPAAANDMANAVNNVNLVFNVKNYGAVGNGTTDDLASVQATLDAAVAAGGGIVYLPRGTYKLTNKIVIGSNTTLQGEGSQSVLKPIYASTGTTNRGISNDWINGNSNITLKHFKLDRSGNGVTNGIILNGVENLLIDGIEVSGYPALNSGAIAIGGTLSNAGPPLLCTNVRVVNCYFSETSNFAVQPGFVDGCVIANNTAENCFREVFSCEPEDGLFESVGPTGAYAKNVVISGNTCVGSNIVGGSLTGIIVVTGTSGGVVQGVSVTGNSIRQYGNTVQTVNLTGTVTGGTFTLTFKGQTTGAIQWNASAATVQTQLRALSTIGESDVSVSGSNTAGYAITFQNDLDTAPLSPVTATSYLTGTSTGITVVGGTGNVGILVVGGNDESKLSNVSVTGNTVSDTGQDGILIGIAGRVTDGVVVSGNSVTNCTGSGIHIRQATRTTVTGNYVYGASHDQSIQESSSSSKNLIALNYLRDAVPLNLLYNNSTLAAGNQSDTNVDFKLGGTHALQSNLSFDRNSSSSTSSSIFFYRDSSLRWAIQNTGTESGSNAGSNINFLARTDAGAAIGSALTLNRSDLSATVGGKLTVGTTLELGNATDTTLSRSAAGTLAVEGVDVLLTGGALGTPASGTLTNCTFPTLNQNTTGSAATLTSPSKTVGQNWFPSGYISGQYYYACSQQALTGTNASHGNSTARVTPWIVTDTLSVTRMFFEFTVAGEANSVFRIGVWNHDATTGGPGTLAFDAGTISTGTGNAGSVATGGTAGIYEITVSETLSPGAYWVGGAVQSAATTQPTIRTNSVPLFYGPLGSSLPAANSTLMCYTFTAAGAFGTAGTLSRSTTTAARIGFKVA
jgi:hypothetical protein